jgi:hypothetical protein
MGGMPNRRSTLMSYTKSNRVGLELTAANPRRNVRENVTTH